MRIAGVMRRGLWGGVLAAALLTPAAAAQELADFDYENLRFRGFAPEWGYLWPTRVEATQSLGLRLDLGYLGPGLRIVPSISYWNSTFKASEVRELEERVASLITSQTEGPRPTVDLGVIDWSDVVLAVDAQVVWRVPYGILTFAGVGAGTHLLNGTGPAIDGTFVEDLLDSVTAGFNVHAGLEYPLVRRFRLYGQGRYEVLGDLQYAQIRFGGQIMTGSPAPGEERIR
jgi:opacity protein-like surface antigen